jgi:hypothetical protein
MGQRCGLGRMLEVNRKMNFKFLAAEMDGFKWKFEFE